MIIDFTEDGQILSLCYDLLKQMHHTKSNAKLIHEFLFDKYKDEDGYTGTEDFCPICRKELTELVGREF